MVEKTLQTTDFFFSFFFFLGNLLNKKSGKLYDFKSMGNEMAKEKSLSLFTFEGCVKLQKIEMKALLCVKLLRSLAGCTELCH